MRVTCCIFTCRPRAHTREAASPITGRAIRKPSINQADPLLHPQTDRRVPRAHLFTHVRSLRDHAHEWHNPSVRGPRTGDDHGHSDPSQARTPHEPHADGERTIPVMVQRADRAAPAPLQRVITDQIHTGPCWYTSLDEKHEHLATHRERRPSCSGEHVRNEALGGCLVVATGTQRCSDRPASLASSVPVHTIIRVLQVERDTMAERQLHISHEIGKGQKCSPGHEWYCGQLLSSLTRCSCLVLSPQWTTSSSG
jgi:hypothetical protein